MLNTVLQTAATEHGDKSMNNEVVQKALTKVKTGNIIWLVISVIMIIAGLPMILGAGYGLGMIALAIWNLVQVGRTFKIIKQFEAEPSLMVYYYKNRNYVLQFILNFVFGAVIGVIATVYEAFTQKYILDHEVELMNSRLMADQMPEDYNDYTF